VRIVKALPDAFLYQYDGEETEAAGAGDPGRQLLRLKFRPNPAYQPPTHAEQVLVGMDGFLVIDPVARRIVRIDGTYSKKSRLAGESWVTSIRADTFWLNSVTLATAAGKFPTCPLALRGRFCCSRVWR